MIGSRRMPRLGRPKKMKKSCDQEGRVTDQLDIGSDDGAGPVDPAARRSGTEMLKNVPRTAVTAIRKIVMAAPRQSVRAASLSQLKSRL